MFCPECGKKIEDNSKFCRECGAKIEDYNNSNDKISASEFLAQKEKEIVKNNSSTSEKKNNNTKIAILGFLFLGIVIVGTLGLQIFDENTISDHVNIFDCHGSFHSEFEYGAFSNQYYVAPMDVYSGTYGTKFDGGIVAKARFDKSYNNVQLYVEYLSKDGRSLDKTKATLKNTSATNWPETRSVTKDESYRVEAEYYGSEKPYSVRFYVNNRNDDKVDVNNNYVCELNL